MAEKLYTFRLHSQQCRTRLVPVIFDHSAGHGEAMRSSGRSGVLCLPVGLDPSMGPPEFTLLEIERAAAGNLRGKSEVWGGFAGPPCAAEQFPHPRLAGVTPPSRTLGMTLRVLGNGSIFHPSLSRSAAR